MCPTYEFNCPKCDVRFETNESIVEYDGDGECPYCKNVSSERILSSRVHFIGTKVQSAEYNPGLGQVIKNKAHRDEIAKQKGLIEIGNQDKATMHKEFDTDRQKKLDKSWDDV